MPVQRPDKRHLMRWTVEHDQRLLLAIQYVCSDRGIRLPWDAIARQLDPGASEGAVSQHLSKLRSRLVEQGQPVPPSLRRGGPPGSRSAAPNIATSTPAVAAPAMTTQAVSTPAVWPPVWPPAMSAPAVSTPTVSTPAVSTPNTGKGKKAVKASAASASKVAGYEDEDEESVLGVEDERAASDDDYEPQPAKRIKRASGSGKPKQRQVGVQSETNQGGESSAIGTVKTESQAGPSSQNKSRGSKNNKGKNPVKRESGNALEGSGFGDGPDESVGPSENGQRQSKVVTLRLTPGYTSPRFPRGLNEWQGTSSGGVEPEASDSEMKDDSESDDDQKLQAAPEASAIIKRDHTGNVAQNTNGGGTAPAGITSPETQAFVGYSGRMQYPYHPAPRPGFHASMPVNVTYPGQGEGLTAGIAPEQQHFTEHQGGMRNIHHPNVHPGSLYGDPVVNTTFATHGLTFPGGVAEQQGFAEQSGRMQHMSGFTSQSGFPFPNIGIDPTLSNQVMSNVGGSQGASSAVNTAPLNNGSLFGFNGHSNPQGYFHFDPRLRHSPLSPVPLPFELRPVSEVMAAAQSPDMEEPGQMSNEELSRILDEDMLNRMEDEHGGSSDGFKDGDATMEHVSSTDN